MKKKGFTLIELLAIIILLGIIVAFATISLSSFIQKSNKTMCEQKEKYILTSAIKYGEDHLNDLNNTSDSHYGLSGCRKGYKIRVNQLINYGYVIGDNEAGTKLLIPGKSESTKTFNTVYVCLKYENVYNNKNLDDYASSYNYHGNTNYQVTATIVGSSQCGS